MAYLALYREWRPQSFSEVVGQEHITKTLQNALENNRIAHAYLFCGPRGTGKTTTAKVLAKALNCLEGPAVEPCENCENCRRITEGNSLDVIEIDAASNRGIDEIRDLREKVKFAPVEGKYKVYIIDEVHMLTMEAFNALLKTLEEPPSHVVFILATTEPHKIPLTILSRCQRFDFRRISLDDIISRLRTITGHNKINVTEGALLAVARFAEGGMRDALSLLDQCISLGGQEVTEDHVNAILGTVQEDILINVTTAISSKDITGILKILDDIIRQGKDVRRFLTDLTEHFRNILLVKVSPDTEGLIPVSEEQLKKLLEASKNFSKEQILGIIEILTEAEKEIKWAAQPRIIMELALIKAVHREELVTIENLAKRVLALEEKLYKGAVVLENKTKIKPMKVVKTNTADQKTDEGQDNPELLEEIKGKWTDILQSVKKIKVSVYARLRDGIPVRATSKTLTIGFSQAFHKETLEHIENRSIIEGVLEDILGKEIKIRCQLSSEENEENEGVSKKDIVTGAIQLFGSDIVEIKD